MTIKKNFPSKPTAHFLNKYAFYTRDIIYLSSRLADRNGEINLLPAPSFGNHPRGNKKHKCTVRYPEVVTASNIPLRYGGRAMYGVVSRMLKVGLSRQQSICALDGLCKKTCHYEHCCKRKHSLALTLLYRLRLSS